MIKVPSKIISNIILRETFLLYSMKRKVIPFGNSSWFRRYSQKYISKGIDNVKTIASIVRKDSISKQFRRLMVPRYGEIEPIEHDPTEIMVEPWRKKKKTNSTRIAILFENSSLPIVYEITLKYIPTGLEMN